MRTIGESFKLIQNNSTNSTNAISTFFIVLVPAVDLLSCSTSLNNDSSDLCQGQGRRTMTFCTDMGSCCAKELSRMRQEASHQV
jgi:hypothetical protein